MEYRDAREVAQIRRELRDRLMAEHHEGTSEILDRLRELAKLDLGIDCEELLHEYERWKVRFELLAASARRN